MSYDSNNCHPGRVTPKTNVLADGIFIRPILTGERSVDHGYLFSLRAIFRCKESAAQQRNAESREVIRRNEPNAAVWPRIVRRRRPPFDFERRESAIVREWQSIGDCSILYARNALQLTLGRGQESFLLLVGLVSAWQREYRSHHSMRLEARIQAFHLGQAAKQ